jgi:hypothetical protein
MSQRVVLYCRPPARSDPGLPERLRQAVDDRGDTVAATYTDDAEIIGRGKYTAWRRLISCLDDMDEIIVSNAGDIPGRSIGDLLTILGLLCDHGVRLRLLDVGSGTETCETGQADRSAEDTGSRCKANPSCRGPGKWYSLNGSNIRGQPGLGGQFQPSTGARVMHFLLIAFVLMVGFPIVGRVVGSIISAMFWLIVIAAVLGVVSGAIHS